MDWIGSTPGLFIVLWYSCTAVHERVRVCLFEVVILNGFGLRVSESGCLCGPVCYVVAHLHQRLEKLLQTTCNVQFLFGSYFIGHIAT